MRDLTPLPIDAFIPDIVEAARANGEVLLRAPPGTGKSTRLPPALAKAFPGKVIVLEPRRLAARMCATRVADEWDLRLGAEVGYRVRFDVMATKETQLEFITEGLFTRSVLQDPNLSGISAIVLDEFHERHIHSDIALGLVKMLRATVRPDLTLIVMSATLATDKLAAFLPSATVFDVPVKHFPVRMDYLSHPMSQHLEKGVVSAVLELMRDETCPGHILVFLSGMMEQNRCRDELARSRVQDVADVLILHSQSTKADQQRVFADGTRRKIILATNIAETSLTINGVTGVVDSGFAKVADYSPFSGIARVVRKPISQASAIQRAGRSGRTSPGVCKRLFTLVDMNNKPVDERPEILRSDLAQVLLEQKVVMAKLPAGLAGKGEFPWLDPPEPAGLVNATELLILLGALDAGGAVTAMGMQMAGIPLHPRLSHIVVAAPANLKMTAVLMAAVLAESEGGDLGQMIARLGRELGDGRGGGGELSSMVATARQIARMVGIDSEAKREKMPPDEATIAEMLLGAYPDRVCGIKHSAQGAFATLCRGGTGELAAGTVHPSAKFAIAWSAEEMIGASGSRKASDSGKTLSVRIGAVQPLSVDELAAWAPQHALAETTEVYFDEKNNKARSRTQLRYFDLILEETVKAPTAAESAVFLAQTLEKMWPKPFDGAEFWTMLRCRVALLVRHSELPESSLLSDVPPPAFFRFVTEGWGTVDEAIKYGLHNLVRDWLPSEVFQKLDSMTPATIQLKGKRILTVQYFPDRPPMISSKIQDYFGTASIPKIIGGKLPLTVELLAPNATAVQVTQDLAGFWRDVYPGVRQSLGRQYPRHFWPEDPLTAPAIVHRPRK